MKYRDFYKDLLLEIKNGNFEYAYHAGPHKLTVSNIIFDRQSLGFHVGTMDQSQWVSLSKNGAKQVDRFSISKFKVFEFVGNLYMVTFEHDMAWEHADILLVELLHAGEIDTKDAHNLIESWYDVSDENINELHILIDKAYNNFGNKNFNPMDSFDGVSLNPDVYKNKEKLSQIRKLLVKYDIGAIKYKNEVEGTKLEYSICILDKSIIIDA